MNERNDITSARCDQRMQTEGNGILQPQRPQHCTFHVLRRLLMEDKTFIYSGLPCYSKHALFAGHGPSPLLLGWLYSPIYILTIFR